LDVPDDVPDDGGGSLEKFGDRRILDPTGKKELCKLVMGVLE
jgi:hypothetical protein